MPDDSKIKTVIKCQNIAPLENLYKEIPSSSLKIGVFANNGCGKTFISRLFRLTEKQTKLELNADGTSPTDITEDITINFQEKTIPTIPETNYLYHTFNQDYVEENKSIRK